MTPEEQPTIEEMEKSLPQPPKPVSQTPLRIALALLALGVGAVIAWFFHVAPTLPKEKSDYDALEHRHLALIDFFYVVDASRKRSDGIQYKIGYAQGRIDEMTEIMRVAK